MQVKTNLTKLFLNKESSLGALYRHKYSKQQITDIEPMVRFNMFEAHRREHRVKGLVPNPASLLEAIEQLPEPADMTWSTHFKTFRLLHVDLLFKCAIKIGMGDVNGAKFKVLQGSQSKDNANGGIPDSGSKGLLVIKARTL